MKERYTVELTENQIALALRALYNESFNDEHELGEYSYARCYTDLSKKLIKKGYWCEAFEGEFKK